MLGLDVVFRVLGSAEGTLVVRADLEVDKSLFFDAVAAEDVFALGQLNGFVVDIEADGAVVVFLNLFFGDLHGEMLLS